MERYKAVTIKDLTEDNPTLCLSALRVFGKCHQCPQYKRSPNKRKCNPVVPTGIIALIEHKKKLQVEIDSINRTLGDKEESR